MSAHSLGRWQPLSVTATIDTYRGAPFRWWLSGGHAFELHLGRSWRHHDDTDAEAEMFALLGAVVRALRPDPAS